MTEAETLAIALEDEFIQGRISNHSGRKAAALLRSQAAEIERLREALKDATDGMEFWGGYASEYFQKKHDLQGDIATVRAALGEQT